MSPFFRDVVFALVMIFAFIGGAWFGHQTKCDIVPDEVAYAGYRACIKTSRCKMTVEDYVDYYEIKWRLEQEPSK